LRDFTLYSSFKFVRKSFSKTVPLTLEALFKKNTILLENSYIPAPCYCSCCFCHETACVVAIV